jgi:hypothetical protein
MMLCETNGQCKKKNGKNWRPKHRRGNESPNSSRSLGQKLEKRHLSRDESEHSSRKKGQNSTKMGCVRGARNESPNSSRSLGQKLEKRHLSRNEFTDSVHGPGQNWPNRHMACTQSAPIPGTNAASLQLL